VETKINKGVELMLQPKDKKGEESPNFQITFGKMVSLFKREFHLHIDFKVKKQ